MRLEPEAVVPGGVLDAGLRAIEHLGEVHRDIREAVAHRLRSRVDKGAEAAAACGTRRHREASDALIAGVASSTAARGYCGRRLPRALDPAEVARIRAWCEASIDARLGAYQPDERFPLRVAHPRVIRWRGAARTIRMAFDQPGQELAALRAGARTSDDLRAEYPFLPTEALARTLAKLEEGRFLVREGEGVRLLFKGWMVS